MITKTIKSWVNGVVQDISVPDVAYTAPTTIENRISALITTVVLPLDSWRGDASPYYQTLTSAFFTANSMVDLQLTPVQLAEWQDAGLAFATSNDDGVVTVYCAGGLPEEDIVVQIKVQEVVVI